MITQTSTGGCTGSLTRGYSTLSIAPGFSVLQKCSSPQRKPQSNPEGLSEFHPCLGRHLPAALLASFVKRISRLSLRAPPAALVLIIPFVYNILKSHPTLMEMIHNPVFDFEKGDSQSSGIRVLSLTNICPDPYDPFQESPLLTRALQSSLWELSSQRNHYLTSVSVMAQVFSQTMRKAPYNLNDFSDHSTTTVCANLTTSDLL